MGQYNFQADLLVSEIAVQKVIALLEKKGATDIETNDDGRYDVRFTMEGQTYTAEVKEDRMYHTTQNLALEYESRNKKSGVASSVADFWCYVLDKGCGYDGIYFVRLNKLRRHLQTHQYPQSLGGDDGTSKLYLVPITRFIRVFERKG
jgi:hypothetical protein